MTRIHFQSGSNKVTDPDCERVIAWDDPALGINWRVAVTDVTLSNKDRKQPNLAAAPPAFEFLTGEFR